MSSEELEQLRLDLTSAFDVLDDNGGNLEELNEIADAIDSVKAEQANRVQRTAVRDRVHLSETPAESEETDGDDDGDDEGDGATQVDADDPGQWAQESPEVEQQPQPESGGAQTGEDQGNGNGDEGQTAGGRPSLDAMRRSNGRNALVPMTNSLHVSTRLVAAGDVAGFSAGQEITTTDQLSLALMRKLQSLGRGGSPDDVLVASLIKEYPEERQLGDDGKRNEELIDAVITAALTASGGICQPLAVDYNINTIGSTARPFQASLPSFSATRGGVKFTPPPSLADVIGVPETWTLQDDIDATPPATTPRKACFRIDCGTPIEATVYGIPVCVEVGNFMGRFTPEMVTAQTALLDVATARMAELTLINAVDAGSTAVTSTGILGTIRTVLPTLDLMNAGYRYRNRLDTATLRMVLPAWVKEEVRADLAMEMAHDRSGDNNLMVTDAQIAAYFNSRNVNVVWTLEDKANSFGAAQGAGALNAWPGTFVAYVYAEGTWQFLDGGRIDLGVVRDSELNSRNDYQIWREDFEGIAKRGNESLKVTVTTKPTGMSAGTLNTSA